MHDQVHRVATGGRGQRQVEELAVPGHLAHDQAGQAAGGGIVGLQHGDRRHIGVGHGVTAGPLTQESGQRLDFGQLRHTLSVSTRELGPTGLRGWLVNGATDRPNLTG